MSFFQKITDFFEYLFNRNSPEVQKKIQAKKIESEINQFRPELYKDGELIGTIVNCSVDENYLDRKLRRSNSSSIYKYFSH